MTTMTSEAPKTHQNTSLVAVMSEPSVEEIERSLLALAWVARSSLSEVERAIAARSTDMAALNLRIKSVADTFGGIAGFLSDSNRPHEQLACDLAAAACFTAYWHGRVYRGATERLASTAPTSRYAALYERLHHRATVQWGKATEAAREEAHRALALLCDAFPNAFDHLDPNA